MADLPIILASQSMARRKIMENAGLHFSLIPASVDEEFIIMGLERQNIDSSGIALELSKEKALKVAKNNPEALVIGSDQILEFEEKIITKSQNPEEAREKLNALKGKSHKLLSAVTIAKDEEILWQHMDEATLTMHDLDDELLDEYCARAGVALTRSVGGYELESYGAWLFSSVQGDYFTILGMPLLPLLAYLQKEHGFKP